MSAADTRSPITLSLEGAFDLSRAALCTSGARDEAASLLARAAVESDAQGYPAVGLAHLLDYCDGFIQGRINGDAVPAVTHPRPMVYRVDGKAGIPHLGFQRVLAPMAERAAERGLALFLSHNAFTCAALGYFTQRLAERGLIALAATGLLMVTAVHLANQLRATGRARMAMFATFRRRSWTATVRLCLLI